MKRFYLLSILTLSVITFVGCGNTSPVNNTPSNVITVEPVETSTPILNTEPTLTEVPTLTSQPSLTTSPTKAPTNKPTTPATTNKTDATVVPTLDSQPIQTTEPTPSPTKESVDYTSESELISETQTITTNNMNCYEEVLKLVNRIRKDAGISPLTLDVAICQAATMRAIEMDYSDKLSHTRPNGTSYVTIFNLYNIPYKTVGENIAAGYPRASTVVEGFKNSPKHYANLIDKRYTKLGVGMSNTGIGTYNTYWVLLFLD